MGHRIWNFELDGRSHKVELNHGSLTGKKTLKVDDKLMPESWDYLNKTTIMLFHYEWAYHFKIDHHNAKIYIHVIAGDTGAASCSYDLYVDNHLIKPEKEFLIFYDFGDFLIKMMIILFFIILIYSTIIRII